MRQEIDTIKSVLNALEARNVPGNMYARLVPLIVQVELKKAALGTKHPEVMRLEKQIEITLEFIKQQGAIAHTPTPEETAEISVAIEARLSKLRTHREELVKQHGEQHPEVAKIDEEIKTVVDDLGLKNPVNDTTTAGQSSAPSPHSLQDDVQYFPAGPESLNPSSGPRRGSSFVIESPGAHRRAFLTIDIQDPGITVAIRRRSTFDGAALMEEEVVSATGSTTMPVKPGDYEIMTVDKVYGWGGMTKLIALKEDEETRVAAGHDIPALAAREFKSTELLNPFYWNGEEYRSFNAPQRLVLQTLLRAELDGHMDVDLQTLLDVANKDRSEADHDTTLEEVFEANVTGNLFGTLILPGEGEGKYHLTPLLQATLTINIQSPAVRATVKYPQQPQGGSLTLTGVGPHVLKVLPGEYTVITTTPSLGWRNDGQPAPELAPEQNQLNPADGDNVSLDVTTDWSLLVLPEKAFGPGRAFGFQWYSPTGAEEGGYVSGVYGLSVRQARVISRLLQALADGSVDVASADLLKASGDESATDMQAIFNDLGRDTLDPWKFLISPGEATGTWRLYPLPPEWIGEAEHARLYGEKPARALPAVESAAATDQDAASPEPATSPPLEADPDKVAEPAEQSDETPEFGRLDPSPVPPMAPMFERI